MANNVLGTTYSLPSLIAIKFNQHGHDLPPVQLVDCMYPGQVTHICYTSLVDLLYPCVHYIHGVLFFASSASQLLSYFHVDIPTMQVTQPRGPTSATPMPIAASAPGEREPCFALRAGRRVTVDEAEV